MEKVLQILVVFGLLMLVVSRFYREREPRFRPYDYLNRLQLPLPAGMQERLIDAVFGTEEAIEWAKLGVEGYADAFLFDEDSRLLFCYSVVGRLVIYRRGVKGVYRQVQELAAPLDCTAMALDPEDGRLYFEVSGYLFVYGAG
ncbi:MAG TPA: hypothetical protein VG052_06710 [Puia sp.]|jgi:hypothetical protein|nr:hypothetical protein [Puia sp.]